MTLLESKLPFSRMASLSVLYMAILCAALMLTSCQSASKPPQEDMDIDRELGAFEEVEAAPGRPSAAVNDEQDDLEEIKRLQQEKAERQLRRSITENITRN